MHCGLLGVKQEEVFPKEEKEFDIRGEGMEGPGSLSWMYHSTADKRANIKVVTETCIDHYVPCKLLFSFSILISRICSMMAFLHRALNSLADLLRPTISAQDAL